VFVGVYPWRSNRGCRAAGDAGPKPARRVVYPSHRETV